MKKSNPKQSFSLWKEYQIRRQKTNENSWTALIFGSCIFFVSLLHSAHTTGVISVMLKVFAGIGFILFLIGGFCPNIIDTPMKYFKKGTNFIGLNLLRVILFLIYGLFLLISYPVSFFSKRKNSFYKWSSENIELPDSAFSPYREQVIYAHSSAVLSSINNIFHVLEKHKILFLLPIVMILLILGLVFFFISANSVFSFVYALF